MGIFSMFGGKPKSVLGIDIGTSSVKIIEVSRIDHHNKLENYGMLNTYGYIERFNNAIQTSSIKMLDREVGSIIRDIVKEAKVKSMQAVMSISGFSSFFTLIDFPAMPEREITKSIPYQAKKYIPIPLSEVQLTWSLLPAKKNGTVIPVALVAVPKEVVVKYKRIAKLAELELLSLEVESFSLARGVFGETQGVTAVLDIGSRVTQVAIIEDGYVRMVHNFDTAGDNLTRAIAHGLGLNLKRAEEIKREHGLAGEGGNKEVGNIMSPVLEIRGNKKARYERASKNYAA